MSSKSSNIEDFKSLIGMALQNKFSWKSLGSLLEEMAPNLSEYKQLVTVLLTELESLHQQSKVVNKPDELTEIHENDIKAFETSCVEDTPICDTEDQQVDDLDQENKGENVQAFEIVENIEETITQMCENNQNADPLIENFECDICNRSFKTKNGLRCHKKAHVTVVRKKIKRDMNHLKFTEGGAQCMICQKHFNSQHYLSHHMKMHGEKSNKCTHCEKTFARSTDLKRHEARHTLEKPFQCKFCAKSFALEYLLNKHQKTHVSNYHCKYCGKTCTTPSTLKTHERIHSGEKPFQCRSCDKGFVQLGALKIHERIHNGERPYKCKICEQSFTQKSSLDFHVRRHHTGEKSHECKICGKGFYNSSNLVDHSKVHSKIGTQLMSNSNKAKTKV